MMNRDDKKQDERDDDDISLESEEEGTGPQTIKKLRERLHTCEKEKREYLEGWQRAKADFVNARKEDAKQKEIFVKFAQERLIEELLSVVDSFEMATSNKEAWEKSPENWRKGIEHIHSQLTSVLERNGLKRVHPLGEKFDPSAHESVEVVPAEKEEHHDTIVAVLQNGYTLHGKILRPARVRIAEWNQHAGT